MTHRYALSAVAWMLVPLFAVGGSGMRWIRPALCLASGAVVHATDLGEKPSGGQDDRSDDSAPADNTPEEHSDESLDDCIGHLLGSFADFDRMECRERLAEPVTLYARIATSDLLRPPRA